MSEQEIQLKIDNYSTRLEKVQNAPITAIKKYTVNSYSRLLEYYNKKIEYYKNQLLTINANEIIVNDPQEI
ncbi:hypothetical protein [Aquimarina algiphila]|uniref:hypothetical protein n=1 Tax=Aquimarina algiphila TaxID=2047982 RepID=UPI00248FEF83|nr:hypothetical protein [Aquimarina algiphila]